MSDVIVRDAPDQERFVAEVDGEVAGFTVYHIRGGHYFFVHTEINEEYAGKGIAKTLVREALDAMREGGHQIVPVCPYVWGFIQRNPEYEDLVEHEIFDKIAARLHMDE